MTRSRLALPILAIAIVAIAVIIATSGSSKKTAPLAAGSAVSLKQTSLGRTLADANGRTLYLFQADRPNASSLSSAGRAVWPPFTAATKPSATGGAVASRIGTIPAAGGALQVTYNGHPLYYYVGDRSSGQTRGQGLNQFGALWYVLGGGGNAITSAPATPAPASPAGGGYGGY